MIRRATAAVAGGGRLVVMHTLAAELAQEMATRLDDAAAVDDIEIAPFTTVMGIHTGPGLVGIAWDATPGNDREGAAG